MIGFTLSGRRKRDDEQPTKPANDMLLLLQGRRIYQGTVDYNQKMKRRRKGKIAKQSRKANRG